MSAKIFTDKDVHLGPLLDKTCAVLGYGAQGRAHALNLRDSGIPVVVGLPPKSRSRVLARRDGLRLTTTAAAVRRADVVFLALPDTKMAGIYRDGDRAPAPTGTDAALRPRFRDSLSHDYSAKRCRRGHGRAERARSDGAQPVHRRPRRALRHCDRAGCERTCASACPRLRQGNRRNARRRYRDDFPGRNRG